MEEGIPEKKKQKEELEVLQQSAERESVFLDSSMVEHSAVNRVVVGSSPTRGV